jgi:membrane protein required for colicin V production
MVHTAINIFDLIVFGVIGLSALLSFFRGFVREVLSLGAWVGAAIITLYAFPHVAAWLKPHISQPEIASGIAALCTFIGSLIILSVFNSLLLKFLKSGSDVGLLDNALGLCFGGLRGALLVAVGFFIFSLGTEDDQYPEWMKASFSLPYVAEWSELVRTVAPSYLDEITPGNEKSVEQAVDKAVDRADEQAQKRLESDETRWPTLDDLSNRMDDSAPSGGGY